MVRLPAAPGAQGHSPSPPADASNAHVEQPLRHVQHALRRNLSFIGTSEAGRDVASHRHPRIQRAARHLGERVDGLLNAHADVLLRKRQWTSGGTFFKAAGSLNGGYMVGG